MTNIKTKESPTEEVVDLWKELVKIQPKNGFDLQISNTIYKGCKIIETRSLNMTKAEIQNLSKEELLYLLDAVDYLLKKEWCVEDVHEFICYAELKNLKFSMCNKFSPDIFVKSELF